MKGLLKEGIAGLGKGKNVPPGCSSTGSNLVLCGLFNKAINLEGAWVAHVFPN